MRLLPTFIFLLLAACAESAASGPANCGFVGRSTLPLEIINASPIVPATFDGVPARLVVDTGSMQTIVTTNLAERAHLALDPHLLSIVTGIGGTASYRNGRVGLLKLGDIPVSPAIVTIMPQVPTADGNLGMDILGDVDLDIDLGAGNITLYRGMLCPGARPPWAVGASELKTDATESRRLLAGARPIRLRAIVELDGRPARAVLDTGAHRSLAIASFAARLGVNGAQLNAAPLALMAGLSQDMAVGRIWRFRQIRVGNETIAGPVMVVADMENADFDVLLGMDFLAGHRIWLSFGARRIFVAGPSR